MNRISSGYGQKSTIAPLATRACARCQNAGCEQVGVVAQEGLPHGGVPEQERLELLGKDVERADRIPGLARHLRLGVRGRRNGAEVAVGEELDLVVVVERRHGRGG